MTSKIILSYRRSDSDVITGRMRDKLATYYGEESVFMDIDSIPFGYDYRKQINEALLETKIFIAVIGLDWLGAKGNTVRIKDENDPVRIEVETALRQHTAVIPVLVNGAKMPGETELPPSLHDLCYLNAAEVSGARDFHQHMNRLINAIDQTLKIMGIAPPKPTSTVNEAPVPVPAPSLNRKWILLALGGAGCAILAAIGFLTYPSISTHLKPTLAAVTPNSTSKDTKAQAAAPAIAPPPFTSAACKPETASFYDDFHKPDPGWNFTASDIEHYADGQLVVSAEPSRTRSPKYLSLRYENVTVCAHVKSPPQLTDPNGAAAGGVIFGAADNENYYLAHIVPNGNFAIYRRIPGVWLTIVPRTKSDQINTGPDAVNEVSVVIIDNFGALFINNVKVAEFPGQWPKGGGAIGVSAGSENTAIDAWRFLDIAVMDNGKAKTAVLPTAPSGPTIGDCKPVNTGDFQDTFAKQDPGWGFADPSVHYANGQMSLMPVENKTYIELYRPLLYKNATVCVTVKTPLQVTNVEDTLGAGLVFWAIDYKNLYAAQVFPNGTFGIFRKVNDEWATVVPRTKSDAVKKNVGAVNQLQVVLNSSAGVLYINGVKAQEFRAQPPKDGGSAGLFSQSEVNQKNDWRFLNFTIVENQ